MLLATTCVACGAADGPVCRPCAGDLTPAGEVTVAGVDRCWALFAYAGSGPPLVAALKYANRRGAVGPLARAAAALVLEPVDLVTWVPAEPGHRRERGFDQGELVARAVARRLRRPCRRVLVRAPGAAQTGRGREDRRAGPALTPTRRVPSRVLLVDDVVTTGASLRSAAGALRRAGADRVLGLALAATPPPGG